MLCCNDSGAVTLVSIKLQPLFHKYGQDRKTSVIIGQCDGSTIFLHLVYTTKFIETILMYLNYLRTSTDWAKPFESTTSFASFLYISVTETALGVYISEESRSWLLERRKTTSFWHKANPQAPIGTKFYVHSLWI